MIKRRLSLSYFVLHRYGGERELLGTRDVLAEEDEVQPNGKIFKKLDLGDYRWLTYDAVDSAAECLGRGLRALKLNRGEKACLFADTRAEFFITAQAAFKQVGAHPTTPKPPNND